MTDALRRDIDRTLGALEVAEQQFVYWQNRTALLREQLAAKERIAAIVPADSPTATAPVIARHVTHGTGYIRVVPRAGGRSDVTTEAGSTYGVHDDQIRWLADA